MIGENESKKLDSISLSHSTVERHIVAMSDDTREQIVNQVKEFPFYSIHLDECIDIASQQQFSVFIRYISNDDISEYLLFCKVLQLHTKGGMDNFLSKR